MATIPTPRSYSQILGDMIDAFLSRMGLKSMKIGGPILSIFESAAQSDLRSSQDTFDLLNATSLDRAEKLALDRIGADEDIRRITQSAASGPVTITDSSFTKITSKIYQGKPAPIVGSATLYVADASSFPSTGSVYLGRGTNNYEGALAYTSKTDAGTHWVLTLSDNTRRFHNTGETVVLAQGGNRAVSAGTLVQTPQGNTTDAVKFSTLFSATIPDGETEITGVQVIAQAPGVGGNVPATAINAFVTPPFTGAGVSNPLPLTNAQPTEDDKTFRERIRAVRQSRSKGTALALTTAVTGITSVEESKRVTSASLVRRQGEATTLYIDDGTGYEEHFEGVAVEPIIDRASGGEQYFQVAAAKPVTKATIISGATAPFVLSSGMKLALAVGGITYEHTFSSDEFRAIGNATSYEVVSSINGNPALGFSAATMESGTKFRVFAKGDTLEDVEVATPSGIDANDALLLPLGKTDTLRLYKNDRLLSKDGTIAQVTSNSSSAWGEFTSGVTLEIAVDKTPAVTYTFVDQDFIDARTGYTTVGRNSAAAWASVFEARIPGISATGTSAGLVLSSNAGRSARAQIQIVGGTLVTPGQMFDAQTVVGSDLDYTLDRNTGQIKLETALAAGDSLSAGTISTRAFVESSSLGTVSVGAPGGQLWFAADGSASIIATGLNSGTVLDTTVSVLSRTGPRVRITANSSAFSNVESGDWMIAWDSAMNEEIRGRWHVAQAAPTYVEIERQGMVSGRQYHTATLLNDGRILVVGGLGPNGVVHRSCEIYDPVTDTWSATGSLIGGRYYHSVSIIPSSGKVLVVGGINPNIATVDDQTLRTCEIWDPATGIWSSAASLPATHQRSRHFSGTLTVPSERIIVAGGIKTVSAVGTQVSSTYLYNAGANTWSAGAVMTTGRYAGASVVLSTNDKLMTIGGAAVGGSDYTDNVEVYDANTNTWSVKSSVGDTLVSPGAVLLADNTVLVAGGENAADTSSLYSATYDVGTNIWTGTANSMTNSLRDHVMVRMSDDNILVAFGRDGTSELLASEVYDVGAGLWMGAFTPVSAEARINATAVATGSKALVVGGSLQASAEYYDGVEWVAVAGLAQQAAWSLATQGIAFVRATSLIQEITIPTGATYTARSFVDSLNTQLEGCEARVFRTNSIRVNTSTYQFGGDIAMVAADAEGAKLQISADDAVENLSTHLAVVEAGNSQAGTPLFTVATVNDAFGASSLGLFSPDTVIKPQDLIVGLKSFDPTWSEATPIPGYGHNLEFVSAISAITDNLETQDLTLRGSAVEWISGNRVYPAASLAIGPSDDLVVVADQDVDTKRFTIPMFRRLKPTGAYASQSTFKDADNGNATLASAFGLDYDFNDFALYMSARTKTFSATPSKSMLWRYTRPGPDGNNARLRFVYQDAPSTALSVTTDVLTSKYTDISVALPTGAAKTLPNISNSTKIGLAADGAGDIKVLTFLTGFPVSESFRDLRLKFKNQTVNWTVAETITGVTSGATCTVTTVVSDAGTTGVLVIGSLVGSFVDGETLNGSVAGAAVAKADGTQYAQIKLTLTLPQIADGALADINNHGLIVTNSLYLASSNFAFSSGVKTITEIGTTGPLTNTVSYVEGAGGTYGLAFDIGTLSYDTAEAAFAGATPTPVAVSDFIRISSTSGLDSDYEAMTMRVSYLGDQVIQGYVESFGGVTGSTLSWGSLGDAASLVIFPLDDVNGLASAIATKVTALADADDSTCPVSATVLGSGLGLIDSATWETYQANDSWEYFLDGVHYVKTTTSPALISGDYQLTFKSGINSDLATACDWTNEAVYLAPITTKNLVDWLSTPAVTGLSSVCSVDASSRSQKLQIASLTPGSAGAVQVQGGTANSGSAAVSGSAVLVTDVDTTEYSVVTVPASDTTGFFAGMWMDVANTEGMPKSVIVSGTTLTGWSTAGVLTLDSAANTPVYAFRGTPQLSKTWQIEKQGRYVAFSYNVLADGAGDVDMSTVEEGDWVRIIAPVTPTADRKQISEVNTGIFRVIRVEEGYGTSINNRTFWIENANAIEETSESDVAFFTFDSLMPGDKISVSTDLWGTENKGVWTVETVGKVGAGATDPQFVNSAAGKHTFTVSTTDKTVTPIIATVGALGSSEYRLVTVNEGQPGKHVKQIRGIAPNQGNGAFADIKFETHQGYGQMSSAAGTVLRPLDKLAFSEDLALGIDGYQHTMGLIAEATRTIYGDPRDPAAYPGVAAAGATINVSGSLVKRITCSLSVRIRTVDTRSGPNPEDVAGRIRSAVASVINKTGVGKPIAISDILKAAGRVNGVFSVSMLSPTFNAENDLINVQPYEKPLVLNLDQDILVSFAGD